jgi:hypothetical protein
MENIHVAWRWAFARDQPQRLLPATLALWLYLDIRGQMGEGTQMIGTLGEGVMKAQAEGTADGIVLRRTQAMVLVGQGGLNLRMGKIRQGREEIMRAASLLEDLNVINERIVILPQLGLVAMLSWEYGTAHRVLEEALTLAQDVQD